jgi:flagellar biosynthesis regulator FlaF
MADDQDTEDGKDIFGDLSAAEKDAAALSDAAIRLDQARGDDKMLVAALDHNLELWVGIRTIVSQWEKYNPMPMEARENLVKLSQYVADTTFAHGKDMGDKTLDSLININLQIAQGLLEGSEASKST